MVIYVNLQFTRKVPFTFLVAIPFPEERFIDWNFVSSSKEKIEEAKQKWKIQSFEKIEGDETDYIPYPTLT